MCEAFRTAIYRVLSSDGDRVVATGFSMGVFAGTCAHVIRDAFAGTMPAPGAAVRLSSTTPGDDVVVAELVLCGDPDVPADDIAILKLADPVPHPGGVTVLDETNLGHPFSTIGFPPEYSEQGNAAVGSVGRVNAAGLVELLGRHDGFDIRGGFSGAPVCDEIACAVIGMVTGNDDQAASRRVGFMLPMSTIIGRISRSAHGIRIRPFDETYYRCLAACAQGESRALAEIFLVRKLAEFAYDGVTRHWIYQCLGLVGNRLARSVLQSALTWETGYARSGAVQAAELLASCEA